MNHTAEGTACVQRTAHSCSGRCLGRQSVGITESSLKILAVKNPSPAAPDGTRDHKAETHKPKEKSQSSKMRRWKKETTLQAEVKRNKDQTHTV